MRPASEQTAATVGMSTLLTNVTNSIWHAFSALQHDHSGLVHKSKLKVLTANIGTLLDLYGIEKGLDHFRSTSELDFESFKYYLQREVFLISPETFNFTTLRSYEEKIEEVCWLVCHKKFSHRDRAIFPNSSIYQIFRIFCFLGRLIPDEDNKKNYQVLLPTSEAGLIAERLVCSLGMSWDPDDWDNFTGSMGDIRLSTFIAILESKCRILRDVEEASIIEVINEIYQTFIKDVIKKGYLFKKGYLLPNLREYWFVLQPCELTYYKSPSEKLVCGTITLTPNCLVEISPGSSKQQKFLVTTTERSFELATQDHKTRLQWVSALQLAIDHSNGLGYQRGQKSKRLEDFQRRKCNTFEVQKTKILLQEEKKARLAAENQAQELAALAQEENKKIVEMRNNQTELERLLAEETQAKRDEEIVRALQARVLAEEWEKREELERLQEEQREMLASETLKRKQFEEQQKIKEIQLKEAEDRLKQLEVERQKLDEELRLARNKIRHSEDSQQILEEKLIVMNTNSRDCDKIRRAVSFMPTSGDKTVPILQARAATLRKHSRKDKNFTLSTDTNNIIK